MSTGLTHKEVALTSRHRRTTSVLECLMRFAPGHTRLSSSVSEPPSNSTMTKPSIVSASRLHRMDAKCAAKRPCASF